SSPATPALRALESTINCQPSWLVSPRSPAAYRQPPVVGCCIASVCRTFGQTIGELRKQWTTLSKEIDVAAHIEGRTPAPRRAVRHDDDDPVATVAAPRFEPPAAPDA
ncbi:MAG: hypothetical protein ACKOFX_10965, partial [Solirubrobacterales bacterium]